jgi:hypothetical protein
VQIVAPLPPASAFTAAPVCARQRAPRSAGDHVPLLVATTLEATADPHTFAAAGIVVTAPLLPIAQVRVCTDGSCASGSSFSSTLGVETVSGQVGTVQLIIQAENTFLFGGTADASADPFIFVDPSFPGAGNYSVLVSDGVGNVLGSVPVPPVPAWASLALLGVGFATLARRRYSSSL